MGILETEPSHNILSHYRSCRCSKRKHRRCRENITQRSDFKIGGTEVITPLRYAMRLIHSYQPDIIMANMVYKGG